MQAVVVGEAMLELSRDGERWRMGYGGDTLNTAIHLARSGISTAYLTAVGSDPFSVAMVADWRSEGLDVSLVLEHPTRHCGLYAIATDAAGERSFTYWRDKAAAREMFELDGAERAMAKAARASLLSFSLISLAILPPSGRDRLLALARRVRAEGGMVAFDGNYRPRLWSSPDEARAVRDTAVACADIGLPTLEDEAALSGAASALEVADRWKALGCGEVVVKLGADGCLLPDGRQARPAERLQPVDTSGAGDAFNAGYLAGRMSGEAIDEAARRGHRLAGWTIMRKGAIPPRDS